MVMVSATDPVRALPVSAKLASLVPPTLARQQYGNPLLLASGASSDGLATPFAPGAAGGTSGTLTGGFTGPPITWLTVCTDTFCACNQAKNALKFAVEIEYGLQSLSHTWWNTMGSHPPRLSALVTRFSRSDRVQVSRSESGALIA